MPRRQTPRNPLFNRRHFADDVIILCVRWYLRFKLSYKDMAEIAWELGVRVSPSTILRWVVRYSTEFEMRWRRFELRVGGSWRADERISRSEAVGCTYTVPSTNTARRWNPI